MICVIIIAVQCGCSSTARIPAFQAGCVGSIPITRSKLKAPTLVVGAIIFYIDGNRTRSNNKQSSGLFVRRGNERKRGDRHGSAETNSHHPLQIKSTDPCGWCCYFYMDGNRTRKNSKKNKSHTLRYGF